ncbi:MAG: VWA domain-containing protein [Chloroflexota bacterium]
MRIRPLSLVLAGLVALATQSPLAAPVAVAQDTPREINVELILDSSGSMAQRIGTETRMQIAKRVLKQVVTAIPDREGINVGFRIYGHKGNNTTSGKAVSCRSSDLQVPIDGVDKTAINTQVDRAQPTGWTPLAYSLGRSRADFGPSGDGVRNAVVLLTDGLETCGGDPCAVAGALHNSDIALTTHVIGFALESGERRTLQCIADQGGGLLLGAQNADQLTSALFEILGEVGVVSLTGTLEIESVDGVWPHATAVCTGSVTDSNPSGERVVVRFDRTNLAEVPVGTCDITWREPSGDVASVSAEIESDRLTRIRGSLLAFPQGAGERYRVTDASHELLVWDAPVEAGDRVWVQPADYLVELTPRVGDPILIWADVRTSPGTIVTLHAGTEP